MLKVTQIYIKYALINTILKVIHILSLLQQTMIKSKWTDRQLFGKYHILPIRSTLPNKSAPTNINLIFLILSFGGLGGISSEILLGQWQPAGATPHHAKPILCLWLEIRALHQVLLTSMQHGFQSRPPVKNGLDAVGTDVRWLHTSDLGLKSCG